ncbi:hypothetical protein C1646_726794 [Rhizophagus diaphanus]|nr:hypothetical protein C1646_726794 [Rhizophagus diaphanus] [Rhizophagus sp. MUCL 43196]
MYTYPNVYIIVNFDGRMDLRFLYNLLVSIRNFFLHYVIKRPMTPIILNRILYWKKKNLKYCGEADDQ